MKNMCLGRVNLSLGIQLSGCCLKCHDSSFVSDFHPGNWAFQTGLNEGSKLIDGFNLVSIFFSGDQI